MTDKLDILTSLASRSVKTRLAIKEDDRMIETLENRIKRIDKILKNDNK